LVFKPSKGSKVTKKTRAYKAWHCREKEMKRETGEKKKKGSFLHCVYQDKSNQQKKGA